MNCASDCSHVTFKLNKIVWFAMYRWNNKCREELHVIHFDVFFELLISFWVRYCSFFEMTTKPPFFRTRGNIRDCFSYWIWFKPMAIKESDTCIAQIGCRAGEFMRYANASFNLIVSSMHINISMWIVFAAKWLLVAIFIAISLSSFPCYFNARKSNCTVNTYTWLIILN